MNEPIARDTPEGTRVYLIPWEDLVKAYPDEVSAECSFIFPEGYAHTQSDVDIVYHSDVVRLEIDYYDDADDSFQVKVLYREGIDPDAEGLPDGRYIARRALTKKLMVKRTRT